ncbi:MAG: ATP-dependent zinc metalloprotease FtsH [Spirochaetes bacterium]|nr:ATP-dependent zinc metalloprotease FtsH [Spirochaetota bacterium]MBN2769818.1 ATP-dependent zinc metalloprotease FtsH [Spirochaetota bacterium]
MNNTVKQLSLVAIIILLGYFIYTQVSTIKTDVAKVPYSQFIERLNDNSVLSAKIFQNNTIKGKYISNGKELEYETIIPYQDPYIVQDLLKQGVELEGQAPDENQFLKSILGFLPWLLFIGFFWFIMMRQVQSTGNKAMSFGKSRAKLNAETTKKVTFEDVAGVEEAKDELSEVVDFLKTPEKFSKIGARIPKGILLMGPPGTGKTLLARAIAGEAGVKFFSISGSDFVEMFVGVGASRVRDLFEQGKKNAPCIIFVDEIDAVGRLRGAGLGGGHDEREQTLNQLLVEMDGFESNEGVIIVAATNRPDVLDPALLRPGRFDRQVVVDVPDIRGREKILAVHSRNIPMEKDVDLKTIAKGTPGFTGADLANLVNEGALVAARNDKTRVGMHELEEAKDKVLMGPERKSMILSDEEKRITAYHEAGHALIGHHLMKQDTIHKVTIIPRGRALGLTMHLPEEEKHNYTRQYWLNMISFLFGGHVAEKLVFNETTTGSSNDIERATTIARRMICEWGMSDRFGPMAMGKRNDQPFIGRDMGHDRDYSEATAQAIDEEVLKILQEREKEATRVIETEKVVFEKMAEYLIERETLNSQELKLIFDGESLPPLDE